MIVRVKEFIDDQPRPRLFFGAVIVLGLLGLIIFNPDNQDYYMKVQEEIPLAMSICENAADWVRANPERLKMTQNVLKDLPVNGEIIKLKYIKYPRAIILHDGYAHPNAQVELFCTFTDPRGRAGKDYFFDYYSGTWVDKTMLRR